MIAVALLVFAAVLVATVGDTSSWPRRAIAPGS